MSEETTGSHAAGSEPEDVGKTQKRDTYFDDDVEILNKADKILVSEKDMGIVKQEEDLISWSIEGFYTDDEKNKRKNRLQLNASPPVFVLQRAGEEPQSFYVTKSIASELAQVFDIVNRGYLGLPEKDNREKLTVDSTVKWVKAHKITSGIILVIVAFVILSQFIQF